MPVDSTSYDGLPQSPATAYLSLFSGTSSNPPEADFEEGQLLHDYVIGKVIGRGAFGTVREAYTIDNSTKQTFAMKIIKKPSNDPEAIQSTFSKEINIWKSLDHPNILKLINQFETDNFYYCVMEYTSEGSLLDRVRKEPLSIQLIIDLSFDLACALRYLHEDKYIIHRDVKLENCLIQTRSGRLSVLLCDFGMADFYSPSKHHDSCGQGSLPYAAPEVLLNQHPIYDPKLDVWSFGVVLYALAVGSLPFVHSFEPKLVTKIVNADWDRQMVWAQLGGDELQGDAATVYDFVELFSHIFVVDRHARWSIRKVCEHAIYKGKHIV
ncbi:hypothetical protein CANCADRAFT_148094 [Tortispora caseinolytica NRRL Y-17796]|uniref:Protein kinase domain-containing protein n=1 Tax=Tortispora caseinolytica NRRL Y-17796 TaxID=767744 RepID=A0A1E4TGD7_9ASCO|nr:hypothetical protein CANCADRAFT_148094 [Tortispora caseinolytica NRRL Y-17796]